MTLKGKFILAVVTILLFSYGALLVYISDLQNRLIIGQAEQQARMLYKQILLTRQWVADHQGLFLMQSATTRPNAFLHEPVMTTENGLILVKRNPAMVTRELSEYAAKTGMGWFRVTSLRPVNPDNAPDAFERDSLISFIQGTGERLALERQPGGPVLRYTAPLVTETSCLTCHSEHGYRPGDIRGALSITIPITWAAAVIHDNNRTLLLLGLFSVLAAALVMLLLFNRLVARPIRQLASAMAAFPDRQVESLELPVSQDEIGSLGVCFKALCQRLTISQQALATASEKGFRAEKLAALGQLTAGIAHEINNPLAGMLNCVKTMQEEPDNADLQKRYLELLHKGLKRIEQTMRQLLNYGRAAPLHLHQANIDAIVVDCLELLGHRLRDIEVKLDLRCPDFCCIDSELVKQIVMNIILNAIQAMPGGGRLGVASLEEHGAMLLTIEDSGPGIDAAIQDRIFDPFFTTKEVGEGTGLGLAVTQAAVQRLNGRIDVRSQPGAGTVFIVTLPIDRHCLPSPEGVPATTEKQT
ncbi:ATP-binding protein [Desulfobulbus sp.]|uniref:ATP-binding protein n=1 Tax=Desulfobulbus sp. TaxID=895 RepID=UPI00286F74D2|nr:ATP-binding protein [Desulfobulbus sp.]